MFAQYSTYRQRTATAPPFQLTPRDEAIIAAVHHFRMLERRQVEHLFFCPQPAQLTNTNRSRERLRLLFQHGYLERIARPFYPGQGSAGPVYRLGRKGAQMLAHRAGVSIRSFRYWGWGDDKDARKTQVRPEFLSHGLMLADVRMTLEHSAKQQGWTLQAWRDDLDLRQAGEWDTVEVAGDDKAGFERIPLLPDSYFVLGSARGRAHFFVEVDRSTESIAKTWRRKILGYKHYVLGGQFHRRYGVAWPHTPLRILSVTTSSQRAEHLKAAAERFGSAQASPLFLFADLSTLLHSDALTQAVWQRAACPGRVSLT